jgi:hypothetical protein
MLENLKGLSWVVVGLMLVGCTKPAPPAEATAVKHTHEVWWCGEHGVPEEECGQCDVKLAAKFQKEGDWCQEHKRPDSQCFVCHPELEAKFAARYEAKYGKPPPKHGEAGHDHEHGHEHDHKDEPKS